MLQRFLRVLAISTGLLACTSALAQGELSYRGDAAATRAFMLELAELYAAQRRVTIQVEISGTTDGIDAAASQQVDLAGSARPQRTGRRAEQDLKFFPLAWDGLVVIVHPNNPLRNIGLVQLRDIYAGRTTRWNQIGGEDAPIELLVVDAELDGLEYVLRQLLFQDPQARVNATRRFADTRAMEQALEQSRNAIAVTSFSAARRLRVKILSFEGRAPSTESIQSGDYLLFFPVYLVSRDEGPNRNQVRDLMRLAQSPNGRRQIRRSGAVPYTDGLPLVSRQLERDQLIERLLR